MGHSKPDNLITAQFECCKVFKCCGGFKLEKCIIVPACKNENKEEGGETCPETSCVKYAQITAYQGDDVTVSYRLCPKKIGTPQLCFFGKLLICNNSQQSAKIKSGTFQLIVRCNGVDATLNLNINFAGNEIAVGQCTSIPFCACVDSEFVDGEYQLSLPGGTSVSFVPGQCELILSSNLTFYNYLGNPILAECCLEFSPEDDVCKNENLTIVDVTAGTAHNISGIECVTAEVTYDSEEISTGEPIINRAELYHGHHAGPSGEVPDIDHCHFIDSASATLEVCLVRPTLCATAEGSRTEDWCLCKKSKPYHKRPKDPKDPKDPEDPEDPEDPVCVRCSQGFWRTADESKWPADFTRSSLLSDIVPVNCTTFSHAPAGATLINALEAGQGPNAIIPNLQGPGNVRNALLRQFVAAYLNILVAETSENYQYCALYNEEPLNTTAALVNAVCSVADNTEIEALKDVLDDANEGDCVLDQSPTKTFERATCHYQRPPAGCVKYHVTAEKKCEKCVVNFSWQIELEGICNLKFLYCKNFILQITLYDSSGYEIDCAEDILLTAPEDFPKSGKGSFKIKECIDAGKVVFKLCWNRETFILFENEIIAQNAEMECIVSEQAFVLERPTVTLVDTIISRPADSADLCSCEPATGESAGEFRVVVKSNNVGLTHGCVFESQNGSLELFNQVITDYASLEYVVCPTDCEAEWVKLVNCARLRNESPAGNLDQCVTAVTNDKVKHTPFLKPVVCPKGFDSSASVQYNYIGTDGIATLSASGVNSVEQLLELDECNPLIFQNSPGTPGVLSQSISGQPSTLSVSSISDFNVIRFELDPQGEHLRFLNGRLEIGGQSFFIPQIDGNATFALPNGVTGNQFKFTGDLIQDGGFSFQILVGTCARPPQPTMSRPKFANANKVSAPAPVPVAAPASVSARRAGTISRNTTKLVKKR